MKKIIGLVTSVLLITILAGCGKSQPKAPALKPVDNLAGKEVSIKSSTPYSEDAFIATAIKQECTIQSQLADFTRKYSNENGVNVKFDDNASKDSSGYYLDLEITDAVSKGNAFMGHFKRTKVKGTLYKDGKKLAMFRGQRHSGGGFGAGFKGSCSVLGRTVDTLGRDISVWIKNPTNGAFIGR